MTPETPAGDSDGRPRAGFRVPRWCWWLAAAAWLAGAVIVWNVVFDAHIEAGARDYVDRQQAFIAGRGPHVDIDRAMDAAKASGLRSATAWAALELAPAVAAAVPFYLRRRRRALGRATPWRA